MTIWTKIRWVASILLVFFIVLITNLIDRDHYNRLSNSVTTIYEDRMVAGDLLFEMSRIIQRKEMALISSDSVFYKQENTLANQEMDQLLATYQKTKLTGKEALLFDQLKRDINSLKHLEKGTSVINPSEEMLTIILRIDQHLHDLSKIQLEEGRHQVIISDRSMNTIDLFTQVEVIFLIAMAILIQIIIFYKPRELNDNEK